MTLGIIPHCSFRDGRATKERKMRRAYMSIREVTTTYLEDMTLYGHFEPWNPGACRRR
jgi:hypothetical protein